MTIRKAWHEHVHAHTHARMQPQLFCYFPLQHLVLISFLMRLWLRPIRANYQRRSGVGCMPTMTPVPREKPGWKRPQHFSFCASSQMNITQDLASSILLYSTWKHPCTTEKNYIQQHTWSFNLYWPVANGWPWKYRMGSFHSAPLGELKLDHWCNH